MLQLCTYSSIFSEIHCMYDRNIKFVTLHIMTHVIITCRQNRFVVEGDETECVKVNLLNLEKCVQARIFEFEFSVAPVILSKSLRKL